MTTSWTDGETDEWTDGKADGQSDKQKDRWKGWRTVRQPEEQMERMEDNLT